MLNKIDTMMAASAAMSQFEAINAVVDGFPFHRAPTMQITADEHAFTVSVNWVADFTAGSGAAFITLDSDTGNVITAGTMREFRPHRHRGAIANKAAAIQFFRDELDASRPIYA